MSVSRIITFGLIIVCVVLSAFLFHTKGFIAKRYAAVSMDLPKGQLKKFIPSPIYDKNTVPPGWVLETKPGTKAAVFSVETDTKENFSFLHMEADRASASLITKFDRMDLRKTPILRWRWRAVTLPIGADGKERRRDDQAIGIYVGNGSMFNNKSISYRWDTETDKGAEGNCSYGLGTIKVKWYTLRNKKDAENGGWFIEERNVAEDFKKAWGFYPDDIYLSVSCNSQYTGSRAAADLNWIGFDSIIPE